MDVSAPCTSRDHPYVGEVPAPLACDDLSMYKTLLWYGRPRPAAAQVLGWPAGLGTGEQDGLVNPAKAGRHARRDVLAV